MVASDQAAGLEAFRTDSNGLLERADCQAIYPQPVVLPEQNGAALHEPEAVHLSERLHCQGFRIVRPDGCCPTAGSLEFAPCDL